MCQGSPVVMVNADRRNATRLGMMGSAEPMGRK